MVGNSAPVTDDVSQPSFEELYRAHYARTIRLCRLLLRDAQEAEEAAQEVFLKLLRASKDLSRTIAWEAWLTRVALNVCHDRQRSWWWRWQRADTMDGQMLQLPSIEPTPEETTVSREQRERIWQFLRSLSACQQEALFCVRWRAGQEKRLRSS